MSHRVDRVYSDISHPPVAQERSLVENYIFRTWTKPEQLSYLTRKVLRITFYDLHYTVSIWGYAIANIAGDLINTYCVLWLSTFVDSGVLKSQEEAKEIFNSIITISCISLVVFLPIIALLADRLNPIYVVIISYLARGVSLHSIMLIDDPKSDNLKALIAFIFFLTTLQVVAMDMLFFANQPKDVRGALGGARAMFSNFFTILFVFIAGWQFDNGDKRAPFTLCGNADWGLALLMAGLACLGKVKY